MSSRERAWGGRPQTVDQAVDLLLTELNDEDKAAIRAMSKSDLIDLHFSLGMHIRNAFGLWQGNEALLRSCRGAGGYIHPDDAGMVIIEALWRRLRTQY